MIKDRKFCVATVLTLTYLSMSVFADINEAHYRSKYPFAVPRSSGYVISHSDGVHSIHIKSGIRECDIEDGNATLLAFYKDTMLLKSYTLGDLFPDQGDWDFHDATGVFGWIWLDLSKDVYPKTDGFRGDTFSLMVLRKIRSYNFTTGARIKTEAEQDAEVKRGQRATSRKPHDYSTINPEVGARPRSGVRMTSTFCSKMKISESQFICELCLKVIREASMHEGSWEMTLLDSCHDPIASRVPLDDDEYPLVSFFVADGDWTLYTTHRVVGEVSGVRTEIGRSDFGSTDFGNFKQDLDSPRVTESAIRCKQGSRVFLYESGYASMAPIHYFKFWNLKWPVWRETYRIENEEAEPDDANQIPL